LIRTTPPKVPFKDAFSLAESGVGEASKQIKVGALDTDMTLGKLGVGGVSAGESSDFVPQQFPIVMVCVTVDMLSKNRYLSLI
jgi:hypothetical protein